MAGSLPTASRVTGRMSSAVALVPRADPVGELLPVVVGRFDPVVERGLLAVLGDDHLVCVIASGVEFGGLERTLAEQAPRVVIIDRPVDDAAVGLLERLGSSTGILVLAHDPSPAYGLSLLAAGMTCLARSASTEEILASVRVVARGGRLFALADGARVERWYPEDAPSLTPRESKVLEGLSRGESNAEIALALGIAESTVRTHVGRVFRKLRVGSRQELIGVPVPGVRSA